MSGFTVFAVVIVAVLVAALARRFGLSAPLVVLGIGLAASFIPDLAQIEIKPELILGIVLPPLLYSAALSSSFQDFRASISPILRLGVGLVIVTTIAVAIVARTVHPQLTIPAALLLGAVVAPPDAVAASAVGRKLGLPRRIMTLLGGESLINDATSLTLFKVALAGVGATGGLWQVATESFVLAVLGGIAVGLVFATLAQLLRSTLRDPTSDTVLGLLLPFAAYWAAEEVDGSGVLAVVAAGFLIGQSAPRATVSTRLHEEPLWASVDLMLESFTFALIGLQLRWVIRDVQDSPTENTANAFLLAGVVLAVTLAVRPLYIYLTELTAHLRLPGRPPPSRPRLSWRELLVTSWAGMRGVVTLAAAAAIPVFTYGARPFPARATIQLAAYAVAIGTLLIQGLTLPALIRALGVTNEDEAALDDAEEARVRLVAARAASEVVEAQIEKWAETMGREEAERVARFETQAVLAREAAAATLLRPGGRDEDDPETAEADEALTEFGRHLPDVHRPDVPHTPGEDAVVPTRRGGPGASREELRKRGARLSVRSAELRTKMIHAQREVLVTERNAGRLNDTVMRRILRELDLEEESMEASWTNRL
jgi:CPA1 family monovalent cation:H+ antiporter